MNWKTPLFKIYSDQADVDAVTKIIERGNYWALGPEIDLFEQTISEFVGTKHALTFNSGTSALHTLLIAHDIKGKEVIVPSFTFISTATAVSLAGGEPVFAESEDETYGLEAEDVKKKITGKTKAIIPMHYGGFPSRDIEALKTMADENNLLLIEDAAEALGASINGKKVGSFGNSAMFSFCQNKVITTGEGGVLVTDSEEIYQKAKLIRSHGRVEWAEDYFSSIEDSDYIQVGYGLRMPTMLASLGLSQLNKINSIIELRRKHAHYLSDHLSKIKGITLPKQINGHFQVYQMYTIRLEDENTRDNLQKHLTQKGIMSKIYFKPVHLKTIYKDKHGYNGRALPKIESISKKVLTLPLYPHLDRKDLRFIVSSIREFFENTRGDLP